MWVRAWRQCSRTSRSCSSPSRRGVLLGERSSRCDVLVVPLDYGGAVLISGLVGVGAFGDVVARGAFFAVLSVIAYTGFILELRDMGRDLRRPAG